MVVAAAGNRGYMSARIVRPEGDLVGWADSARGQGQRRCRRCQLLGQGGQRRCGAIQERTRDSKLGGAAGFCKVRYYILDWPVKVVY